MIQKFLRPRDPAEAVAMLASSPGALPLAGGTWLLTGQFRERPMTVVSVAGVLPSAVERREGVLEIGAMATFQSMIESRHSTPALRAACLGMVDRNVRNRATAGGNIGANKSCASLVPLFLAGEARYVPAGPDTEMPAETWHALTPGPGRPLIASIVLPLRPGRMMACGRWSRTSCDVSVLTAAVAYDRTGDGKVRNVRIAMGGLDPHARRYRELEAAFEGKALPDRAAIEAVASPCFHPIDDLRGSAAFKRLRAAVLLADTFLAAEVQP